MSKKIYYYYFCALTWKYFSNLFYIIHIAKINNFYALLNTIQQFLFFFFFKHLVQSTLPNGKYHITIFLKHLTQNTWQYRKYHTCMHFFVFLFFFKASYSKHTYQRPNNMMAIYFLVKTLLKAHHKIANTINNFFPFSFFLKPLAQNTLPLISNTIAKIFAISIKKTNY